MMEPPAEREYAVEPVGVERMRPSEWRVVRGVGLGVREDTGDLGGEEVVGVREVRGLGGEEREREREVRCGEGER